MDTKILIVEDQSTTLLSIKNTLEIVGYEQVFVASDSDQAIRIFKSEIPQLVLMDIRLDGSSLDGVELTRLFRDINDSVHIIYISSHYDEMTMQKVKQTKYNNFITKPFTPEQVRIAVSSAINNMLEKETIFEKEIGKIPIHCLDKSIEMVDVNNILYFEADESFCKVFLTDGSNIRSSKHMGHYTLQKEEQFLFLRISNDISINCKHIKRYFASKGEVIMNGDIKLSVSKNKKREITKKITNSK